MSEPDEEAGEGELSKAAGAAIGACAAIAESGCAKAVAVVVVGLDGTIATHHMTPGGTPGCRINVHFGLLCLANEVQSAVIADSRRRVSVAGLVPDSDGEPN